MRTRRNKPWLAALAALLALVTVTARAAETITYIHWDALGSPVAATDEAGHVIWREAYRPYGQRINHEAGAATDSRWYTGHPQDADTGLVYAGARYYDPTIGRFLAPDPVPFQEDNLQSFNRYAYGENNPYKYVDPDGRMNLTPDCIGMGGACGGAGGGGEGPGDFEMGGEAIGGAEPAPRSVGGGRGGVAPDANVGEGKTFRGTRVPGSTIMGSPAPEPVPKEGRYEFPDQAAGNKPYVGQSGNIPRRLSQHERAGRYKPGTATITEVPGGKTAREISEHQRIRKLTGGVPARQSGAVSNKVDPIGPSRRYLFPGE